MVGALEASFPLASTLGRAVRHREAAFPELPLRASFSETPLLETTAGSSDLRQRRSDF